MSWWVLLAHLCEPKYSDKKLELRVIYVLPCLIIMLVDWLLDNQAVWFIIAQFTQLTRPIVLPHTRTHRNMLTCSSVTRKTATGCGLGTKTFSELSEDAWSQDAHSQNVKKFQMPE